MRANILTCLVALLAWPALLSAEEKKSDQDLFQGEWVIVSLEQEGENIADFVKDHAPVKVFKDNKYTFKGTDLTTEVGEFKLDPKAKVPTIDYKITEGEHKGKRQFGIYKLDGDNLTICLAEEGADARPTKFKTAATGAEYVLFAMKRKK